MTDFESTYLALSQCLRQADNSSIYRLTNKYCIILYYNYFISVYKYSKKLVSQPSYRTLKKCIHKQTRFTSPLNIYRIPWKRKIEYQISTMNFWAKFNEVKRYVFRWNDCYKHPTKIQNLRRLGVFSFYRRPQLLSKINSSSGSSWSR